MSVLRTTDGYFLLSMFSQDYHIIFDCGFNAPLHDSKLVDILNATEKRFLFRLI